MRCGMKDEKEGEEERRGRERRIKNRKGGTKSVPPPSDVFLSAKLGNNMTPIKRRLGKNTTPTNRSPTKPKQSLQVDLRRRRSSLEASSRASLIYTPLEGKSPKYKLPSNRTAIYKKAKTLGNSRSRYKFSINQH